MRLSIRARMMLYIAAPIVLIYVISSLYSTLQFRKTVEHNVQQRMGALAISYANQLDARLREAAIIADTTAALMSNYPEVSQQQIYQQLDTNLKLASLIYGGVVCFKPFSYDPSVELFCPYVYRANSEPSSPILRMDIGQDGYDYTDPQWRWWNEPRNTRRAIWTEPYFDEGAGDILMSTYSSPFFLDKEFRGVTTVDIPLKGLRDSLDFEIAKGARFSVLSRSGVFVFNPNQNFINRSAYEVSEEHHKSATAEWVNRILSNDRGFMTAEFWNERANQWLFYAAIPSTQWHFVLEMDKAQALSEVSAKVTSNIRSAITLLALMLAVIWYTSKRFAQPILKLTNAAEAMAGDQESPSGQHRTHDEISSLRNSFRRMNQAIRDKMSTIEEQNLELLEYKQSLEDKVSNRTRELNAAKEHAEQANKAKSTFLANMSHELRTPMNAVLGFSQLMIHDENLSNQQKETLNIINDSGEHLLDLINDVLDISKIEAGKVSLHEEAFSLKTMLKSIESMFRLKAEEKKLILEIRFREDLPDSVLGDRNKIRQILVNLLGNAVKFTEKGRIVFLINQETTPSELAYEFTITDTGQGIDAKDQEKIFSVFGQSRAGESTQNSTGLGLAISRQYARLMGGDIILRSDTQPGSTFIFKVPLKLGRDLKQQTHQIVSGIIDDSQPLILVADDILNNRLLIKRILSPIGFKLDFANNGLEALEKVKQQKPDLILMDIHMPEMDGIEATRALKSSEESRAIPVIALTASVFENQRLETIREGVDGFLKKPIIQADLLDSIAVSLNLKYRHTTPSFEPETIPQAPQTLPSKTTSDNNADNASQVLIVDDTKVNRIVARGFLKKQGYSCLEADSGAEALKILSEVTPRLILMDRYMPGMDGTETIQAIREIPQLADIPIAIFSSEDRSVDHERLQLLNVTDYVSKPIDQKEFLSLIEKYVH